MAFAGGWICRSCWSSNRGGDTRCYRCKAERTAEDATVTLSRSARTRDEARRELQRARVPAVVSLWPSLIFAYYWRAALVAAVLTGILTVLAVMSPVTPRDRIPFWIAVPVIFLAISFACRWVSRQMRASNPLSFVVGLGVSVLGAWVSLTALSASSGDVTGSPVPRYITIAIWGLSSLFAIIGLLYSLTSVDEVSPPAKEDVEAG